MENHTHITRWNDGEADWEMVIQTSGKVTVTTKDASQADAAAELSEQWSRLMGFAIGNHETTPSVKALTDRMFYRNGSK